MNPIFTITVRKLGTGKIDHQWKKIRFRLNFLKFLVYSTKSSPFGRDASAASTPKSSRRCAATRTAPSTRRRRPHRRRPGALSTGAPATPRATAPSPWRRRRPSPRGDQGEERRLRERRKDRPVAGRRRPALHRGRAGPADGREAERHGEVEDSHKRGAPCSFPRPARRRRRLRRPLRLRCRGRPPPLPGGEGAARVQKGDSRENIGQHVRHTGRIGGHVQSGPRRCGSARSAPARAPRGFHGRGWRCPPPPR